jgi:hypothetical protein
MKSGLQINSVRFLATWFVHFPRAAILAGSEWRSAAAGRAQARRSGRLASPTLWTVRRFERVFWYGTEPWVLDSRPVHILDARDISADNDIGDGISIPVEQVGPDFCAAAQGN